MQNHLTLKGKSLFLRFIDSQIPATYGGINRTLIGSSAGRFASMK